jgi:Zn-finger domain-containing protein
LRIDVSFRIKRLITYGNSKVVIDQVNKACDIKKDSMNAYCTEVHKLEDHFEGLEFHHVSRDNNVAADVLSKLGSKRALVPAGVFVQDLLKPLIRLLSDLETSHSDIPSSRDILMAEAEDDWCLDFIAYIVEQRVPEDKVKREKMVRCSANYVIIGTELYRRSASNGMLMKCIL